MLQTACLQQHVLVLIQWLGYLNFLLTEILLRLVATQFFLLFLYCCLCGRKSDSIWLSMSENRNSNVRHPPRRSTPVNELCDADLTVHFGPDSEGNRVPLPLNASPPAEVSQESIYEEIDQDNSDNWESLENSGNAGPAARPRGDSPVIPESRPISDFGDLSRLTEQSYEELDYVEQVAGPTFDSPVIRNRVGQTVVEQPDPPNPQLELWWDEGAGQFLEPVVSQPALRRIPAAVDLANFSDIEELSHITGDSSVIAVNRVNPNQSNPNLTHVNDPIDQNSFDFWNWSSPIFNLSHFLVLNPLGTEDYLDPIMTNGTHSSGGSELANGQQPPQNVVVGDPAADRVNPDTGGAHPGGHMVTFDPTQPGIDAITWFELYNKWVDLQPGKKWDVPKRIQVASFYCRGPALYFITSYEKAKLVQKKMETLSFDEWRKDFLEAFPSNAGRQQMEEKLISRVLQPGESIEGYLYSILDLVMKCNPDTPWEQLYAYVRRGLPHGIRTQLTLSNPKDVTELSKSLLTIGAAFSGTTTGGQAPQMTYLPTVGAGAILPSYNDSQQQANAQAMAKVMETLKKVQSSQSQPQSQGRGRQNDDQPSDLTRMAEQMTKLAMAVIQSNHSQNGKQNDRQSRRQSNAQSNGQSNGNGANGGQQYAQTYYADPRRPIYAPQTGRAYYVAPPPEPVAPTQGKSWGGRANQGTGYTSNPGNSGYSGNSGRGTFRGNGRGRGFSGRGGQSRPPPSRFQSPSRDSTGRDTCFRCGIPGHYRRDCRVPENRLPKN